MTSLQEVTLLLHVLSATLILSKKSRVLDAKSRLKAVKKSATCRLNIDEISARID